MVFWVILETSGILLSIIVIHKLASANGRGEILDTSTEFFFGSFTVSARKYSFARKKANLKSL